MANPEHLAILNQGVKAWNEWREANFTSLPDLFEADLREGKFQEANFREADLRGALLCWANLHHADLYRADLREANLRGANLSKADLSRADLSRAYFQKASLKGADLRSTDLSGAYFDQTELSEAVVGWTRFADLDLRGVKGINNIVHWGPSSIGVDTVYRSQGKIPSHFLRGAGVPDNFIEYMSSLVGTVFEFYSCFISYSSKDQKFADHLFADLQHNGVRCWFAPHHVKAGEKLHEQIDTAIRLHERLLLILSPDSINSEWVKTEIAKARKREIKEGRKVLFPVRLDISFEQLQEWECFDADRGKDSAREIREYYIPDFTGWKNHDKYEEEFKKLLRDLKKSSAAATA
jgi:hypothetical protein